MIPLSIGRQALQEAADAQKQINTTPFLGSGSNVFRACDAQAFQYGIWGEDPDENFFNILAPYTVGRETIPVFIPDMREGRRSRVSVSNDWCSLPPNVTPGSVRGCRFQYDVNAEQFYRIPGLMLTPNNFRDKCMTDPVFSGNGEQITNQVDYERYDMMRNMKNALLEDTILDNSSVANHEDGLDAWFANWTARRGPSGACAWVAPKTYDWADVNPVTNKYAPLMAGGLANFGHVIGRMIDDTSYFTLNLSSEYRIPDTNWYVLMNEYDAMAVIEAQLCQTLCVGSQISLTTPNDRDLWDRLYDQSWNGGRFGQGLIRTRRGRYTSLMRNNIIPRGKAYLLNTGWNGNPFTLRLAMYDYSAYNSWLVDQGRQVAGNMVPLPFTNNAAFFYKGLNICDSNEVRYHWQITSNAPWTQHRILNIPQVTGGDEAISLATMPVLPTVTC